MKGLIIVILLAIVAYLAVKLWGFETVSESLKAAFGKLAEWLGWRLSA